MMLEELLGEARRDFTVRPEQAKRVDQSLQSKIRESLMIPERNLGAGNA
jgi:hypothetical protein